MNKPNHDLQQESLSSLVDRVMDWPSRRFKAGIRLIDVANRLGISLKQYHQWETHLLLKGLSERIDKIERVEDALAKLEQEVADGKPAQS